MQDTLTVSDPAQIKVLADPIRQAILGAFTTPKTTKQVAKELAITGTKLYHHVDLLEAAGFLRLVETRPNRGTVERYLQVTARRFVVRIGIGDEATFFHDSFQSHLTDFECAKKAGLKPMMARAVLKIDPTRLSELETALTKVLQSLHDENGAPFSIVMTACPVISGES